MKRKTAPSCPNGEHIIEFPLNFTIDLDLRDSNEAAEQFFIQQHLENLTNFKKFASCYKLYKINKIHFCVDMGRMQNIDTAIQFPLISTTWTNRPGIIPNCEDGFPFDANNTPENGTTVEKIKNLINSTTNGKRTVYYPGSEFHISDDIIPKTLNEKMYYMPTRISKAPIYETIVGKSIGLTVEEALQDPVFKNQDAFVYFNPIYHIHASAKTKEENYNEKDISTHPIITLAIQAFVEVSFDRFLSTRMPETNVYEYTHTITMDPNISYDPNKIAETIQLDVDGTRIKINIKIDDVRASKPLVVKKIITITANGVYQYT